MQKLIDELEKYDDIFSACAEVFEYILNQKNNLNRPRLISALTQSLMWFQEACREEMSLISSVKFTASLDALTGGKKSQGIKNLITKQLGIKGDEPLFKGGSPMSTVVKQLHDNTRSRAIHGTHDKIGHDWKKMEDDAETIARACLISAI